MEEKMGGGHMIVSVANNIISPLGMNTVENYVAVKASRSELKRYEGKWNLPEPFVASLVDRDKVEEAFSALADNTKYTFFEKMIIFSASCAIQEAGINTASERVLFVLSTTKGNVFLLDKRETGFPEERVLLGSAARQMTDFFQNPNPPIVVSNACISGVCAQIEAMRNLESGCFDYVVVVGCDVQSAFIVSGFQSFKALSPEPCKPFDANRCGLNLGDAAATIIYTRKNTVGSDEWVACRGAIRNDANHISGPSRTGEGSYRALKVALGDVNPNQIAFINTHGTATVYNDEMESVAIERAGLSRVPVNGLKGNYGHTMGAAGILETILSMYAIDDHNILATRGYETLGVTHPLVLSNQNQATEKHMFIKLLSGFGGCNAALLFAKGGMPC
jgi:3-oxoacyl-[acyl-carrier-protein] synthase-1